MRTISLSSRLRLAAKRAGAYRLSVGFGARSVTWRRLCLFGFHLGHEQIWSDVEIESVIHKRMCSSCHGPGSRCAG